MCFNSLVRAFILTHLPSPQKQIREKGQKVTGENSLFGPCWGKPRHGNRHNRNIRRFITPLADQERLYDIRHITIRPKALMEGLPLTPVDHPDGFTAFHCFINDGQGRITRQESTGDSPVFTCSQAGRSSQSTTGKAGGLKDLNRSKRLKNRSHLKVAMEIASTVQGDYLHVPAS